MSYDFVTIGGATRDITFFVDGGKLVDGDIAGQKFWAFRYGSKVRVGDSRTSFGGGAANAAVNFAGLGFKSSAMVAVGRDIRSREIIKNFKNKKVNISHIQKKDKESSFSILMVGPDHEHIVFSNRAANNELSIGEKDKKTIARSKWVYITSLSGDWKSVLDATFSAGNKIAWNPGHIQLKAGAGKIKKYLRKTDILFINRDEAIDLLGSSAEYKGKSKSFFNKTENLLRAVHGLGTGSVIITRGKKGADHYDGDNIIHQPIVKEQRIADTTGVGDAFNSTFVAGLEIFKGDVKKAMYMGALNTASVVEQEGAQNGLRGTDIIKKARKKK